MIRGVRLCLAYVCLCIRACMRAFEDKNLDYLVDFIIVFQYH